MKKILYLAIAALIVSGLGIGSTQARPPCTSEACGPYDIYHTVCCWVESTPPNCKGQNCPVKLVWECWEEPCDPYWLGTLPVFLPVPSTPDLTPVNLQQSQLD